MALVVLGQGMFLFLRNVFASLGTRVAHVAGDAARERFRVRASVALVAAGAGPRAPRSAAPPATCWAR